MLDSKPTSTSSTLSIKPLGGRVGALIEGIQLSGDLPVEQVSAIREAMLRHKVVFLRDQQEGSAALEAFSEKLGEPIPYTYADPPEGLEYTWEFDEIRSDHWHSDLSWQTDPVEVGILTPAVLPESGGNTVWSNTAAAYEELPEPLQAMANKLWAVHSAKKPIALSFPNPSEDELTIQGRFGNEATGARHPVVRVHPETSERNLFVGNVVYYFDGFARTPGQHIYELFQYYVTRPENTIRWHWRMGDVAIWDNRATQYYGVRDYGDERRTMQRISLKGSVPLSVDGKPSTVVA
ncbi:MAG: TauD/TfdA family dioxygenase [Novosphingobium sp.]|nr:TauD/TfdA family dioxygenase [Novosphingobium sp.]